MTNKELKVLKHRAKLKMGTQIKLSTCNNN